MRSKPEPEVQTYPVVLAAILDLEGAESQPLLVFASCVSIHCLQCFDTVGWAAGRASGLSGGVLAWLFVWSDVQICIWPS